MLILCQEVLARIIYMFKLFSSGTKLGGIKSGRIVEGVISIIAITIFIAFASYIALSVKKNSVDTQNMQELYARFNDIDGISVGSDVKISGYKVGSVKSLSIDPTTYDVKAVIQVSSEIKIPTDSTAAIKTSGILGGKYLALIPGAEEEYLESGKEIIYTQSAINLENLISTFVKK